MDTILVEDIEKYVIDNSYDDNEFIKYLNKNKDKKIIFSLKSQKKEDDSFGGEQREDVLDYLEEVSQIKIGPSENLFNNNVGNVASLAFYYLKDGISYLDLVQEGDIGLIKAIDNFKDSAYKDFDIYKDYWVIREMILFIKKRIIDISHEFQSYFNDKKDKFKKKDETVNNKKKSKPKKVEVPTIEEIQELLDEEKEGIEHDDDHEGHHHDEDKILDSLDKIDDKVNKAMDKLDFFKMHNRLDAQEIEVLNYYFGFGKDRRYSIYEIEKKLDLEKDLAEEIFKKALEELSVVKGRVFI